MSLVREAGARSHEHHTGHSKLLKNNVRLFMRNYLVRVLVIDW